MFPINTAGSNLKKALALRHFKAVEWKPVSGDESPVAVIARNKAGEEIEVTWQEIVTAGAFTWREIRMHKYFKVI
jgi:hypothetical protein